MLGRGSDKVRHKYDEHKRRESDQAAFRGWVLVYRVLIVLHASVDAPMKGTAAVSSKVVQYTSFARVQAGRASETDSREFGRLHQANTHRIHHMDH
jgi:hypothetical protein